MKSSRIQTGDHRLVTISNSPVGKGLMVYYSNLKRLNRLQTQVSFFIWQSIG